MRDAISEKRIALLHPLVRQEVKSTIEEVEKDFVAGTFVRVTDGYRTFEEQDKLFAKGRRSPGPKVTNAKAGSSFHNYGLAFDGVIIVGGKLDYENPLWRKVVEAFKRKGWTWGGDFSAFFDGPHLEKSFGHTIKTILARHKAKNFIPGTQYVNLN